MSNELIDALENKVHAAVETIESLRAEVQELKEERRQMEDKLRGLLERMEAVERNPDHGPTLATAVEAEAEVEEPASSFGPSPFTANAYGSATGTDY